MGTVEIPLFPLRTVLFPGGELPLTIFEDRYKQMVGELLERGGDFGVLLIRSGEEVGGGAVPFDAGTTASIEECGDVRANRFRLNARGDRRFRLVKMLAPRPYPYGEIEYLDDTTDWSDSRLPAALETVRATFPVYFRLAVALTDQWARGLDLPKDPHRLVNMVAPMLRIEEEAKQRLLEIEAAPDRLAQLAEVLDELIARLRVEVDEHHREKYATLGNLS